MRPPQDPGAERDGQDVFRIPDLTDYCDVAEEHQPVIFGGGVGCLVLLASFLGYSLGSVEPLHYGIRYNFFNKYADVNTVYGPGRHLIGPWSTFLIFPADIRSVEFTDETLLHPAGLRYPALHTRTKEGLALHLQVSLQYRLTKDKVGMLYTEFNQAYEEMFVSTIRDTLIRAAADYEAWQLWTERSKVGAKMQEMVNDALEVTYATCWGLQLMVIELPVKFEAAIVATQVQSQKISTREFEQTAAQTRAVTKVIAAEFQRTVKVITAKGQANYTLKTRTARAEARQKVLKVEAVVMESVRSQLKLTGDELVDYQQFVAMSMMGNATLFYGFAEGTQVMMQQVESTGDSSAPARRAQENHAEPDGSDDGGNAEAASGFRPGTSRRQSEEEL